MRISQLFRYSSLIAATSIAYAACSAGGSAGSDSPANTGGSTSGGNASTGGSSSSAGNGSGGSGAGIVIPDSGTGGTQTVSDAEACATGEVASDLQPANVLFLIDRSGSMNCNLPPIQTTAECSVTPQKADTTQPSKWELTRDAIKNAVDALVTSGNVNIAVGMFPSGDTGTSCDYPTTFQFAALDATQATATKQLLDGVVPKGSTPIFYSTASAYAATVGQLTGNTFVVLLTDGTEACATDPQVAEFLHNMVPGAAAYNVRTYAIGVPGSEGGRALLSEIAWQGATAASGSCTHHSAVQLGGGGGAGGSSPIAYEWTPSDPTVGDCHFDMTDPGQDFAATLQTALAEISGNVLSCEIDVPPPEGGGVLDYEKVNVDVTGDRRGWLDQTECGSSSGWLYNEDKTKIILCGQACDDAKKPGATINVVLGCTVIPA